MGIFRQPGTVLTDHIFSIPLNHDDPDGERIGVYGREVVAAESVDGDLPWLVFLQGGPGFGAQRPVGRQTWLDRALRDYRVLLLDQRGTGRSTPANRNTLGKVGDAKAQAEYLTHFRADSIVRDCEWIRRLLIGEDRWSVLGQSFGGFCTVSYLSLAPEGLREAFITGGLPGLEATADDVYAETYPLVAARSLAHYDRYPGDAEIVARIVSLLWERDVRLPSGRRLTDRAFQTLGILLGRKTGSHQLHYVLEDAFLDGHESLSDTFLQQVEQHLSFAVAPLYALLHEPCYAQGVATSWAAERVRERFPEFDARRAVEQGEPILFTGEMIYPETVADDPVLAPLREVGDLLAAHDAWPSLYDPVRLARNDVPVAAAIYHDDMYVPYSLSMPTARAIRGLHPWVTNEYEHDGLGTGSGTVLDRLIGLVRGTL